MCHTAAEGGDELTPRDQRAAFRHSQQKLAEIGGGGARDLSVIIFIPGPGSREVRHCFRGGGGDSD